MDVSGGGSSGKDIRSSSDVRTVSEVALAVEGLDSLLVELGLQHRVEEEDERKESAAASEQGRDD